MRNEEYAMWWWTNQIPLYIFFFFWYFVSLYSSSRFVYFQTEQNIIFTSTKLFILLFFFLQFSIFQCLFSYTCFNCSSRFFLLLLLFSFFFRFRQYKKKRKYTNILNKRNENTTDRFNTQTTNDSTGKLVYQSVSVMLFVQRTNWFLFLLVLFILFCLRYHYAMSVSETNAALQLTEIVLEQSSGFCFEWK